ncbi:MAG: hypothetical protein R2856_32425 [Caldilineaceae bacterium]
MNHQRLVPIISDSPVANVRWRRDRLHGELEYIQNGRLLAFDSLQELTDFVLAGSLLDVEFCAAEKVDHARPLANTSEIAP